MKIVQLQYELLKTPCWNLQWTVKIVQIAKASDDCNNLRSQARILAIGRHAYLSTWQIDSVSSWWNCQMSRPAIFWYQYCMKSQAQSIRCKGQVIFLKLKDRNQIEGHGAYLYIAARCTHKANEKVLPTSICKHTLTSIILDLQTMWSISIFKNYKQFLTSSCLRTTL